MIDASGKETRGAGTASATVRASLEPEGSGDSTRVVIHTTMNVTGRPAQFGRGVIAEVGGKLVAKFADNLAQLIAGSDGAEAGGPEAGTVAADSAAQDAKGGLNGSPPAATSATVKPAAAQVPQDDDSLNLVQLVGPAILKRAVPIAVAVAGLVLLARLLRRRGTQKE